MNVPVGQDIPQTPEHILQHCPAHTTLRCQTWPQGGGAEGEAVGLPPRPGEDRGLRPAERSSDLDSMTEEKLWGCRQDLEKTVDFVQASGLQI